MAMALAEGTANDWLPLVMVDGHGFDAALGSATYAVFAASMTIGRFLRWLVHG
jgi:fucose permease